MVKSCIMNTTLNYIIKPEDAGKTIAGFLLSAGYSSRLVVYLRNTAGSFYIGDTCVFSNRPLAAGDILTVHITEKKSSEAVLPVSMPLSIVYEDEHLIVLNKPAGMPVHPSQGNYGNTLANGLAWYFSEKGEDFVFRAVNRLDRDTSGLLLVAKNMLSSCLLSDQVRLHHIRREYAAIVMGKLPDEGTVDIPIARKDGSTIERIPDPQNGEAAITHYRRIDYKENTDLSFARLSLETGRTHQIRVHMKYIGHPLPGDFLYNPDYRFIKRQALHSAYLSFLHPITEERIEFTAPLPDDMALLFPKISISELF